MPTDSGYNSPCCGFESSPWSDSLCFSGSHSLSRTDRSVNRKLCYASTLSSFEINKLGASDLSTEISLRSHQSALFLLRLCDSSEEEFSVISDLSKAKFYTSTLLRYLDF